MKLKFFTYCLVFGFVSIGNEAMIFANPQIDVRWPEGRLTFERKEAVVIFQRYLLANHPRSPSDPNDAYIPFGERRAILPKVFVNLAVMLAGQLEPAGLTSADRAVIEKAFSKGESTTDPEVLSARAELDRRFWALLGRMSCSSNSETPENLSTLEFQVLTRFQDVGPCSEELRPQCYTDREAFLKIPKPSFGIFGWQVGPFGPIWRHDLKSGLNQEDAIRFCRDRGEHLPSKGETFKFMTALGIDEKGQLTRDGSAAFTNLFPRANDFDYWTSSRDIKGDVFSAWALQTLGLPVKLSMTYGGSNEYFNAARCVTSLYCEEGPL